MSEQYEYNAICRKDNAAKNNNGSVIAKPSH